MVHFCFGEVIEHSHGPSIGHDHHRQSPFFDNIHNRLRQNYGTVDQETESLLAGETGGITSCPTDDMNARICPVSHTEPCENSQVGTFGLLCALCIHSLLEGLAIGVQPTGSKVSEVITNS